MFDVIIDVALFRKFAILLAKHYQQNLIGEDNMIYYLEEVPAASLHMLKGS